MCDTPDFIYMAYFYRLTNGKWLNTNEKTQTIGVSDFPVSGMLPWLLVFMTQNFEVKK